MFGRSKAALVIAAIYLLLVVAAFVIMVLTMDTTPMSGIFLVMLTPPWPSLLASVDGGGANSALVNGVLLLVGGLLNGAVLYLAVAAVAALIRRASRP